MNDLLSRALKHVNLRTLLHLLAIAVAVLAAIPIYANMYGVLLSPMFWMVVSLLLVGCKEAERRLQGVLAVKPSPQQEDELLRLQVELSTTSTTLNKRNKELIAAREENKHLRAEAEAAKTEPVKIEEQELEE